MPDGCYLVNGVNSNGQQRSGVAYFNPFLENGGNDNTEPPQFAYTSNSGYTQWEGSQQKITFPSGTVFTWNIASNGGSDPPGSRVGSADNTSETWSVYRDDGFFMFTGTDGYNYSKIYNVQ